MPVSISPDVGTVPAIILGIAYIIAQIVTHINKFGSDNMGKNATVASAFYFAILGLITYLFKDKIMTLTEIKFLFFLVFSLILALVPFVVWVFCRKEDRPEAENLKAVMEISKIEIQNIDIKNKPYI